MENISGPDRLQMEYASRLKAVTNEYESIQLFLQYAAELLFVDFDQALELAKKTHQMAVVSRDKKLIAHSLKIITQANYRKGSFVLAILKASEAIGCYVALDDHENIIYCNNLIGSAYEALGEYEKALEYHNKSYVLSEKINSINDKGNTLVRIAAIHSHFKEYDKALEYYRSSEHIYLQFNNKVGLAFTYNYMGVNYFNQRTFSEALVFFSRSLDLARGENDLKLLTITLNNIGAAHLELGNLDEALIYLTESMKVNERTGDNVGMALVYQNMGEIYLKQQQYDKALDFLTRSREISEELRLKTILIMMHQNFFDLYTAKNDSEKAAMHYELMQQFKNEVYSEEKQKKIRSMSQLQEIANLSKENGYKV